MPTSRNQLLALMSSEDLRAIEPHLTPVNLPVRKHFERPNKRIDAVYFPESGFASVVAIQAHRELEVGLIGREGMSGLAVALGNHRSPHSTYVQVAGTGQSMPSAELRKIMLASPSFRELVLKYVQAFCIQTTHAAICNAQSNLSIRLARWLLMAHDRTEGDLLPLTHEFLALMLAVRRAGVTVAVTALAKSGFIHCTRAQIRVLDRKGLERTAGESYGVPEAEYRRLLS